MLDITEVKAVLHRAEKRQLRDADYELLQAIADSYAHLTELARKPGMTMDRLRELWLGSGAEQPES